MLTRLHVEHETQSMQISLENIPPRDMDAAEAIMHDIANVLQSISLYLRSEADVSPEVESQFLQELEELSKRLSQSDALITGLAKELSF